MPRSLILGADIVIELMGGIEPARSYILQALSSGADVITANKALLATHGPSCSTLAEQVGAQLYYEAAVGGAIPIIRPLRDSLAGDRVNRILGIVNGTTNFILDRMDVDGETLEDALATATELGYAEADPTADIGGYDAAQKAAILAEPRLPHHRPDRVGLPRGHHGGHAEPGRRGARRPATSSSCSPICERVTDPETGAEGVSARVLPGARSAATTRSPPCTARTTPCSSRRSRRATSCSTAPAPGESRRHPPCSATSSRAARRHVVGGPGVAESTHADLPVLDIGQRQHPLPDHARGRRPSPACSRRSPASSASTASPSRPSSSRCRGDAGTATLVIGTHKATEAAPRRNGRRPVVRRVS